VFLGIAMLTQTAAVHSLRQTYRRDKGMELELRQERQINERKAEVAVLLREEDGWKQVIGQLLADALPGSSARMAQAEVLELAADPAPRFTVADPEGKAFLFTTSPKTLRRVKMLTRRERPVPLDAAVHPAARAEVQAVWEHLAVQSLRGESDAPVLPRQSEWFLVEREAKRKGR